MKVLSFIAGDDLDIRKISTIDNTKIFAFDILSHKFLEQRNISHFIADEKLNIDERKKIFDHVISKLYWYEEIPLTTDYFIDGYNIFQMLDPLYLHQKLLVILIEFNIIKKIIDCEKPTKIFLSQKFSKIVSAIDDKIELVLLDNKKLDIFDKYDFKIRLFSKIISIKVSMKTLKKLQNFYESIIEKFFNFWLNPNDTKPIILLLEFDPSKFSELFLNLKKSNFNLVILNRRKSALSNFQSIMTMRNSKAKLINFNNLLSQKEKIKISKLQEQSRIRLNAFWKNEDTLSQIFSYCDFSYWSCISDFLIKQYEEEINSNIENLIQSQIIFKNLNIKSILYQYESGNSENTTLSQRQCIPSFLLRHGFSSYTKKYDTLRWRYDQYRLVKLQCDQVLLWGSYDYEYYSKFLSNSIKLKIIGSPRHDNFFHKISEKKYNHKTILITVPPMIEWTGLQSTELALRYENILNELIKNLKKIDNVKIIAKLHPGWGWEFNSVLIKIFYEIDSKIPIYSSKSIKQLISECDLMININAEDNQPSTVILEGLILKKPIINISLNEQNNDFEHDENFPFVSISYKSDISNYVNLILNNNDFQEKLKLQNSVYLKKYLSNHKIASKEMAIFLQSFL